LRPGRAALPRKLQRGARDRPPQPGLLRPLHARAGARRLPRAEAPLRPPRPARNDAARLTLPDRPRAALAALAALSLVLVGWLLVGTPAAGGDAGEYLVPREALANHGTPDVRAGDAAPLGALARRFGMRGQFAGLWHETRLSRQDLAYNRHV